MSSLPREGVQQENFYLDFALVLQKNQNYTLQIGLTPQLAPLKPIYLPPEGSSFFKSPTPVRVTLNWEGARASDLKEEVEYYYDNKRMLKWYSAEWGREKFHIDCAEPETVNLTDIAPLDLSEIEKNERLSRKLNKDKIRSMMVVLSLHYVVESALPTRKMTLENFQSATKIMCTDFIQQTSPQRAEYSKEKLIDLFQSYVINHATFATWSKQMQLPYSKLEEKERSLSLEDLVWNACIAHHNTAYMKR